MIIKLSYLGGAMLLSLCLVVPAESALHGRLPTTPGGTDYQAYYDDQLNLTWAADANINNFANWNNQMAWVSTLVIGGVDGWRLPSMDVNGDQSDTVFGQGIVDCSTASTADCLDNEYGYMFHENGVTAASPGPFIGLVSNDYWSATQFGVNFAWNFTFGSGNQQIDGRQANFFAWAVHSGDVGVIPIPAAAWLFGSGLIGLLGLAKRKR